MLRKYAYFYIVTLFFLAAGFPGHAWAVCTSPAGAEGDIRYNLDARVPQYCDNVNWIAMGPVNTDLTGINGPNNPELVGSYTSTTEMDQPWDVTVFGNYAYVGSVLGVTIIDISNPASPSFVSRIDNSSMDDVAALEYKDGIIFGIANLDNKLFAIDVSTPATPVWLGSVASGSSAPSDLAVREDTAFVTDSTSDCLYAFDITDPALMTQLDSYCNTTNLNTPKAVEVNESYAYVVSSLTDSLNIIDIRTPNALAFVGRVTNTTTLNVAETVAISGNYAYVGNAHSGSSDIAVVDISNPAAPAVVESIADAGTMNLIQDVKISGDYLYALSNGTLNVRVINIKDPLNLAFVGAVAPTLSNPIGIDIALDGDHLYVASWGNDSLRAISIDSLCSNPTRDSGSIVYNDDNDVMQYCDGANWVAMGPVPGAGGAGCTSPTRDPGTMLYNDDNDIAQYCDGAAWIGVGK